MGPEPIPVPDAAMHCFWHDAGEPAEGYRQCFECKHMFATAADLLDEHNRLLAELHIKPLEIGVERVFACPFCAHDF